MKTLLDVIAIWLGGLGLFTLGWTAACYWADWRMRRRQRLSERWWVKEELRRLGLGLK